MGRLKTLEKKVLAELEAKPATRDSDRELTLAVYADFYGVSTWTPFAEVMRRKDLPSTESIGRTRRKLQEKNEALRGDKYHEAVRLAAQADYIEYAREGEI